MAISIHLNMSRIGISIQLCEFYRQVVVTETCSNVSNKLVK